MDLSIVICLWLKLFIFKLMVMFMDLSIVICMWLNLFIFKFIDLLIVMFPQGGDTESVGLSDLITTLQQQTYIPRRDAQGPLIFSADHCFSIRGQGTVLTGTVLSGSVAVNDVRFLFLCSIFENEHKLSHYPRPGNCSTTVLTGS